MFLEKHSFDSQPILKGKLVEVRPLNPDDEENLYSVAADPLLWAQHPSNRFEKDEFTEYFSESLATGGALIVIDSSSKSVIGSSRYFGYNKDRSEVEIGWTFLARSHWGGQYNGELKQLMLDHAFKYVDTIVFYIDPNNERSHRSIEKIGGIKDRKLDSKGRSVFRIFKGMQTA